MLFICAFWDHSFLSYAVDKQTNRRTDSKIQPTPTNRVSVGNNMKAPVQIYCSKATDVYMLLIVQM